MQLDPKLVLPVNRRLNDWTDVEVSVGWKCDSTIFHRSWHDDIVNLAETTNLRFGKLSPIGYLLGGGGQGIVVKGSPITDAFDTLGEKVEQGKKKRKGKTTKRKKKWTEKQKREVVVERVSH